MFRAQQVLPRVGETIRWGCRLMGGFSSVYSTIVAFMSSLSCRECPLGLSPFTRLGETCPDIFPQLLQAPLADGNVPQLQREIPEGASAHAPGLPLHGEKKIKEVKDLFDRVLPDSKDPPAYLLPGPQRQAVQDGK